MADFLFLLVATTVLLAGRPCEAERDPRMLESLVETLRRIILEGDEDRNIPVLDPFTLDKIGGAISKDKSYEGEGELSQLIATGLANFEADYDASLAVGIPLGVNIVVTLSIPNILIKGGHNFDALLGEVVHLYGKGNFQIQADQLNVTVNARITQGISTTLRNLDTSLSMGDLKVTVHGLMDGGLIDPLFGLATGELAKYIFEDQKEKLETAITEALREPIEATLKDITWNDLICIVLPRFCNNAEVQDFEKAVHSHTN